MLARSLFQTKLTGVSTDEFLASISRKIMHVDPRDKASLHVAILMGTFQGKRHLLPQLNSLAVQSHANWSLWVSDDGSTDGTLDIVMACRHSWGADRVHLFAGPRRGFAANFLFLACHPSIKADFHAFSDQDDEWEPDKLARAIEWLQSIPPQVPALYCGRTRLVDERGGDLGFSPLFSKPPSFRNALMQNVGGGNTMVFNEAARNLLRHAGAHVDVVTHDWWLYLVVTGCGGRVFYDPHPSLLYRQHDANLVGMNNTWRARLRRIRMLWQGHFRDYNDRNIRALVRLEQFMTHESRVVLQRFEQARQRSLFPRLFGLCRSGIYRQTMLGNLGLVVAALFRRM